MNVQATQPYTGPAYPSWWTVTEKYLHQGTTVVRGQQLTITGRKTSFRFVNHTVAPPRPGSGKRVTREWITVLDDTGFHSFRPDQIRRILPPDKPKKAKKAR